MHGVLERGAHLFFLLLCVIGFTESGLLIGIVLPGDSLLFSSGLVVGITGRPNVVLLLLTAFVAAVAGDQVGYVIGTKAGTSILRRTDGRFVKRSTSALSVASWVGSLSLLSTAVLVDGEVVAVCAPTRVELRASYRWARRFRASANHRKTTVYRC
jgi:membrane protein DedA with SNARE-associated domain